MNYVLAYGIFYLLMCFFYREVLLLDFKFVLDQESSFLRGLTGGEKKCYRDKNNMILD